MKTAAVARVAVAYPSEIRLIAEGFPCCGFGQRKKVKNFFVVEDAKTAKYDAIPVKILVIVWNACTESGNLF